MMTNVTMAPNAGNPLRTGAGAEMRPSALRGEGAGADFSLDLALSLPGAARPSTSAGTAPTAPAAARRDDSAAPTAEKAVSRAAPERTASKGDERDAGNRALSAGSEGRAERANGSAADARKTDDKPEVAPEQAESAPIVAHAGGDLAGNGDAKVSDTKTGDAKDGNADHGDVNNGTGDGGSSDESVDASVDASGDSALGARHPAPPGPAATAASAAAAAAAAATAQAGSATSVAAKADPGSGAAGDKQAGAPLAASAKPATQQSTAPVTAQMTAHTTARSAGQQSAADASAASAEPASTSVAKAVAPDSATAAATLSRSGAEAAAGSEHFATQLAEARSLLATHAARTAEAAEAGARASGATPYRASIAVPVGDPSFPGRFAADIALLGAAGIERAEIRLHPRELGPIRIELSMHGDSARVAFSATHVDTRSAIEQSLPILKELLAERGLQFGGADVSDGRGQDRAGTFAGSASPDGDGGDRTASESDPRPGSPATSSAARRALLSIYA